MAFQPIWKGDYAAPTVKSDQDAIVQIVRISDDLGAVEHRIEVRVQENSAKYQGPTKTAIGFHNAEDVDELITQLQAAQNEFRRQGLDGKNIAALKEPIVARRKPVPVVKPRKPNAAAPRKAPIARKVSGGPRRKAVR